MSEFDDDIFNIQPSKSTKPEKVKKHSKPLTKSTASNQELEELGELDDEEDSEESADAHDFEQSLEKMLEDAGFDGDDVDVDDEDTKEEEDDEDVIDVDVDDTDTDIMSPASESKFKEHPAKKMDPAKHALELAKPWFQGYALQVYHHKTQQVELIQRDTAYQALAMFMQKSADVDVDCQIFALFPVAVNVDLEPDFRPEVTEDILAPLLKTSEEEETVSPEFSDSGPGDTFAEEEQAIADAPQVIRPGSPFQADV